VTKYVTRRKVVYLTESHKCKTMQVYFEIF